MRTIIDQQLKEHFGEDYKVVRRRAKSEVLRARSNLLKWGKWTSVDSSEGGISGLIRTLLCTVIEVGDFNEGVERFYKRLNTEHVNGTDNNNYSLQPWEEIDPQYSNSGVASTDLESVPLALSFRLDSADSVRSSSWESNDEVREFILKDQEEVDLYSCMANNGNNIKEAAEILGWSHRYATKIYRRVYARQRNATNPMPSHRASGHIGIG